MYKTDNQQGPAQGTPLNILKKLTMENILEIYIYNNIYVLYMGFPSGSMVKNPPANAEEISLITGSRRFPGGEHGNPLQYSCLENPHGERSLVGYSPYYHKELDTTEVIEHACMQYI